MPVPGRFYPVEVKGTYTRTNGETNLQPHTRINLSDLGVRAGDYLAMRTQGRWRPNDTLPPSDGLVAVFMDPGNQALGPGQFGQEMPFVTPRTFYGQLDTDIPQDFKVSATEETIVRVPRNASTLAFCVGDNHYSDNMPVGAFGVVISRPNIRDAAMTGNPLAVHESGGMLEATRDPAALIDILERVDVVNWPVARRFSASHVRVSDDAETKPQWRGWYNSGWKPEWSRFNARRPDSVHKGWDVFAPRGSKLITPVGPAYFFWARGWNAGYGNLAVFSFQYNRRKWRLFYAHCESALAVSGRVLDVGVEVATAGCTGNANQANCGEQLPSGGRTDHVHIGLVHGRISDTIAKDPGTLLRWTLDAKQRSEHPGRKTSAKRITRRGSRGTRRK